MGKIPCPDRFYISGAIGWLQLGNHIEAQNELDQVSRKYRDHPDYLVPAWLIEEQQGKWRAATITARTLYEVEAHRSYTWVLLAASLAESAGADRAYEFLAQAPARFPQDASVRYNLAVLACRCGLMDLAHEWLLETLKVAGAANGAVNAPSFTSLLNKKPVSQLQKTENF